MQRSITRRDFLDGVALTVAAGMTPARLFALAPATIAGGGSYPPGLDGWRGSVPAAYAVAHGVRDGKRYELDSARVAETCDLIVIGSGISGLAAAHFYRKRQPRGRVLILENHDDFGGHARRNEFDVDGRTLIGYGGSEAIQSPTLLWSKTARALLTELHVDIKRFEQAFDRKLYPRLGLSRGVFFAREAFGVDKLVTGDPMRMVADDIPAAHLNARPLAAFIADYPLPDRDKADLVALFTAKRDVLKGKSATQKLEILEQTSYRGFIRKYWGLSDKAADTLQGRSRDFYAIGIDGVPANDARNTGYPGFQGLGLKVDADTLAEFDDPYIYHFPDGNASIARLLVRKLIPTAAPGKSMDDIVLAPFDYGQLDLAGAPVRLRLGSTAVALRNRRAGGVDVGYVRGGALYRAQASHVIYAGYGSMLPYLCADIGAEQKTALSAGVKAPLVYVNVALRNWQAWARLGVHEITNPMGFFSRVKLDYPVSLGGYRCASKPQEPILLHMVHVPGLPADSGLDQRAQWRAARALLYAMSFADFELRIRDELTRMTGAAGFKAKDDILGITVNRWGHGYAYGFNSLYDTEHDPQINVVARKRIGHISIAGSDAAWSAYAHAAIDEAARAVAELG